jgi:hypothetical protein
MKLRHQAMTHGLGGDAGLVRYKENCALGHFTPALVLP